jgi:hypothetical protein
MVSIRTRTLEGVRQEAINVRFRSKADISQRHVRFTPQSGHLAALVACLRTFGFALLCARASHL